MSDVTRYKAVVSEVQALAHRAAHPDGDLVAWEDYDALRQRVRELEDERNKLLAWRERARSYVDDVPCWCAEMDADYQTCQRCALIAEADA